MKILFAKAVLPFCIICYVDLYKTLFLLHLLCGFAILSKKIATRSRNFFLPKGSFSLFVMVKQFLFQ
jgi:hypothetical protein